MPLASLSLSLASLNDCLFLQINPFEKLISELATVKNFNQKQTVGASARFNAEVANHTEAAGAEVPAIQRGDQLGHHAGTRSAPGPLALLWPT